jgi:hypothetical protein
MKKLMLLLVVVAWSAGRVPVVAQGMQVAEAKLGKGVVDREITEETTTFAVNDKVYLWLRVTGSAGSDTIKVNWKVDDSVDTVTLQIGGSPWRTWANKTAWKAGEWTVTVTDANDQMLTELKFTVQ